MASPPASRPNAALIADQYAVDSTRLLPAVGGLTAYGVTDQASGRTDLMAILAFYGVHRYQLVWLYYRNRRNEARSAEPVAKFDELPFVTIQLPIYNEQFVIDRLLDACCRIEYPRDRFEIQLLDDSTDETVGVARGLVEHYAAQGCPITYHHRTHREGFKAGALAEGMKTAPASLPVFLS